MSQFLYPTTPTLRSSAAQDNAPIGSSRLALVDQRQALALVRHRVLDRGADQSLRAVLRHRLDADAGSFRKADLGVGFREILFEELEKLVVFLAARLEPVEALRAEK